MSGTLTRIQIDLSAATYRSLFPCRPLGGPRTWAQAGQGRLRQSMTPVPNRRSFQFSLRTMFVVMAVVACSLGYYANWHRERRFPGVD